MSKGLTFGQAFELALDHPDPKKEWVIIPGKRIRRSAWLSGTWVAVQGVELSPVNFVGRTVTVQPYLAKVENATVHPWVPTQDDLFATDWKIA